MIHVERAYVQNTLDVPKGGSSRAVDMSPQLKATLRAVHAERFSMVRALDADRQADLEATQATEAADALVFPNTDGGYL